MTAVGRLPSAVVYSADGRFLTFRTECHVFGMPIEYTNNVRSDE
jgi:hypothetical protein